MNYEQSSEQASYETLYNHKAKTVSFPSSQHEPYSKLYKPGQMRATENILQASDTPVKLQALALANQR